MARRPPIPQPQPAELTVSEMKKAIPRLQRRIAEVEAFEPDAVSADDPSGTVRGLRASIEDALIRTFGNDTVEYRRYSGAASFSWPLNMTRGTPIHEIRSSLAKEKRRSIDLLTHAVKALEERIEEAGDTVDASSPPDRPLSDVGNRRGFVVHGHDVGPREAVARYLERVGFEPIILHEQANQGKTIIEKFEANADVGFAVVLLTPDDVGGLDGETQRHRARQNVVLELGYFIGRLGRERVCALKSGDIDVPSDILGVLWIDFDAAGGWRAALAKELQAVGYEIDWNKVMS